MDKREIFEKVADIFRQVLDDEELELTLDTTLEDLDDWNSLNNSMVIATIEEKFDINFKLREVGMLDSVEAFVDAIEAKLK